MKLRNREREGRRKQKGMKREGKAVKKNSDVRMVEVSRDDSERKETGT